MPTGRRGGVSKASHSKVQGLHDSFVRALDHVLCEIYFFRADSLKFLYVNKVAAENLGYSKEELRELTPLHLKRDVTPDYFDKLLEPLRNEEREVAEISFSAFHYRKDGSCYPVEIRLTASEVDGAPLFVAVALDTTNRRFIEDHLRKTLYELAKLNQYESAINMVIKAVHQSMDLETVMENSVEAVSRYMEPVNNICIYLVEEGEAVMKSHRGYPEWFVERVKRIPYPKGFTWRTIIEGRTFHVTDAENDTVMGPAGRELGTMSYISIPIMKDGKAIGAIDINSDEKNAFGPDELRVLDTVSRQIEIAINNAGYAESLRLSEKALEEKVKQLSKKEKYEKIINKVSRSVHSSVDMHEVMENAVNALGHNIEHADLVQIQMVEGNEAVIKSHRGHPEWFLKKVERIPYPKGLTWKTILGGKSLYVPDTDKDTAIGPAGRKVGIKSYVAMPIKMEGETIGCLGICSLAKNVFSEDELALLHSIAKQIETAILNAKRMEALKLSEARYQNLAEVLPVGVYRTDADGKAIYVNDRLCEITGLGPEQAYGYGWTRGIHPEDRDYLISRWEETVRSGGIFREEHRFLDSAGRTVWVMSEARPERGKDGEIKGYVGTVTDITARKESEDKIQFHASLLDQVRNAVIATDLEGKIIYWNKFAEELYQWRPDEAAGKRIIELIIHEEREEDAKMILKSIKETDQWHGMRIARRKDGSTFPVEIVLSTIRDEKGTAIGSVGVSSDITERTRYEQKIVEQAALLDISRDAILVRDLDQNIIYMNKSAEKMYGWETHEILGKNTLDLFYRENDRGQVDIPLKTLLDKGEWQGELRQTTRDGREIIVDSRWTLVYDKAKKPVSILSVNTDITEKKRFEEGLLRAQRLESIGTLAGGIAHDLNNVLQPIMMSVHLLRNEDTGGKHSRMLDVLDISAQRASDLIKQVLSFARGFEGEKQPLNIKYLISDIETIMKETFPKSIETIVHVDEDIWNISGDFTQLNQVLLNICVNARDAMPDGGRLEISARNLRADGTDDKVSPEMEEGPYVEITISDTGSGIPLSIKDKIYDPFFTTKEQGKGTGLGLSTSWGIVKEHGGHIHLDIDPGEGAKFTIHFPAIHAFERAETSPDLEGYAQSGKGETVLVVDDESAVLDITRLILEEFGYNVVTANNGQDAINIISDRRDEIRVAIVDMMMPVMGGKMVVQALKNHNPSLKIISVSGYQREHELISVEETLTDAFLHKPFDAETLLQTIEEVISTNMH